MDEPRAVDAKVIGAPTASKYTIQESEQLKQQYEVLSVSSNSQRKVKDGVLVGKLVKISVITLLGIGIIQLIIANLAGSAATFAGGKRACQQSARATHSARNRFHLQMPPPRRNSGGSMAGHA